MTAGALDTLLVSLHGVCDALEALEVCLAEDAPDRDSLPIERRATAAVEHAGAAREARLCVDRARRRSATHPWPLVLEAHAHLCDAERGFVSDLGGYHALVELRGYCDEHGRTWSGWFESVERGADACPSQFDAANRAFGGAFAHLVDRIDFVPRRPEGAAVPDPAQGEIP
jgi:hypothetical protein